MKTKKNKIAFEEYTRHMCQIQNLKLKVLSVQYLKKDKHYSFQSQLAGYHINGKRIQLHVLKTEKDGCTSLKKGCRMT